MNQRKHNLLTFVTFYITGCFLYVLVYLSIRLNFESVTISKEYKKIIKDSMSIQIDSNNIHKSLKNFIDISKDLQNKAIYLYR